MTVNAGRLGLMAAAGNAGTGRGAGAVPWH
jgi:hypothetical protein